MNERVGLARTFDELPLEYLSEAGFRTEVLVVDGGSTDGTLEVARERGVRVLRQVGQGKGGGVRQGLRAAIELGADYVAVIDADYSYVAESLLPAFSLLAGDTDLVIGARRPVYDPAETLRAVSHRVADALLSLTAARMSGVPFLDICSGLWGVRTDAVRQVKLESEGFEIEAELFLKMARHGFRVSQVPVTYRPRVGVAKLHAIRDGSRILLTILRFSRALARGEASVDLRYVPTRAPPPEMLPARDWLGKVQALCFSVSPRQLSIVADPGREGEARELARRLWAGEIRVNLTVSSASADAGPAPARGDGDAAATVRLPALLDAPAAPAIAIVRLPQSHAMFYIGPANGSDPASSALYRSGGHLIHRSSESTASFVANLAAAIHGSPEARSNALLYATAGNLGLQTLPWASAPPPRHPRLGYAARLVPNRKWLGLSPPAGPPRP